MSHRDNVMFTTETKYLIKIKDLEPGGAVYFTRGKISLDAIKEAVAKQYPDRADLRVFNHDTCTYVKRLMV